MGVYYNYLGQNLKTVLIQVNQIAFATLLRRAFIDRKNRPGLMNSINISFKCQDKCLLFCFGCIHDINIFEERWKGILQLQ